MMYNSLISERYLELNNLNDHLTSIESASIIQIGYEGKSNEKD